MERKRGRYGEKERGGEGDRKKCRYREACRERVKRERDVEGEGERAT